MSISEAHDHVALVTTAVLAEQVGSPAREAPAREATARITSLLQAAISQADASEMESHRMVVNVLARALRLLLAQMQVLKADTANGRLTVLAAVLGQQQAVEHAQGMVASRFHLQAAPVEEAALHAALPITAEFAASSPSADHVTLLLAALQSAYSHSSGSGVPSTLRAGRSGSTGAAAPPPGSLLAMPLMPDGCEVDTWRACFRCALAALLMQPVDFTDNPAVPEVLHPYGVELDNAKVLPRSC